MDMGREFERSLPVLAAGGESRGRLTKVWAKDCGRGCCPTGGSYPFVVVFVVVDGADESWPFLEGPPKDDMSERTVVVERGREG